MFLFTLQTKDQQQYGPIELGTLKMWVREGRVERDNFVYDHTHLKWVVAGELPQLMENFHLPSTEIPYEPSKPTLISVDTIRPPSILGRITQLFLTPIVKKAKPLSSVKEPNTTASSSPVVKALSSNNKQNIRPEAERISSQPGASPNANDASKPPTVLFRITQLLTAPFTKGRNPVPKKPSAK